MSNSPSAPRHGVIVPVKPVAYAKSRLRPLGDDARRALVVAFAVDTVRAALASPLVAVVQVVTDDVALAAELAALGAEVLPDGTTDDLNGSLLLAAAELTRRHPGLAPAALCADLPALRPEELTRALAAADVGATCFVPDAEGVGTTALLAPDRAGFAPAFGSGSRTAHLEAGARELELAGVASLRRDVDTPEDLRDALRLGVGARTAEVVAGHRL